ncbi:hypothetical protein TNCV_784951 [Trichonephila clavipes]|nr:hypothetical protein TNCV_784951 [Trichonephila clavipes]
MSKRKNNKQMFLSLGYALSLLQWFLHTISPYSALDCPTVLEVKGPNPQSASVSFVGCSPEYVIVLQDISPKHRTHVLWDLNQGRTLANEFERYIHFPVSAKHHQSGVVMHYHP